MAQAKGTSTKGVIAIALAAALVAGGAVFVWKNGQVSSLQTQVTASRVAAVKATTRSEELESKLAKTTLALRHQERKNTKAERELTEAEASPSPSPAASTATDLADGKWYAKIKGAQSSPPQVTVDVMQFLTGKAAQRAAEKDGNEVFDDYYIVNDSTSLRTLPVGSSATVKVLLNNGGSTKHETITFTEFVNRYNSSGKNQTSLHLNGFWFWLADGAVVRLEEQFVP